MCPSGPSPTTISKTMHLNRGAFFFALFSILAASYSCELFRSRRFGSLRVGKIFFYRPLSGTALKEKTVSADIILL